MTRPSTRWLAHMMLGLAVITAAFAWVAAKPAPSAEGEERVRRSSPSAAPSPTVAGSSTSPSSSTTPSPTSSPSPSPEPTPEPVSVAAAGDIACAPGHEFFNHGRGTATWCRAADTRAVIRALDPDVVLPLGDTQYDSGRLSEYYGSYDLSWGKLLRRTRPAIGNHEYYASSNARGYFSYFGDRAGELGKGWYAYDLGAWHVVALNSNCQLLPCVKGSEQHTWLRDELAANPASCTLAYFHHPRFSSGPHGDDPSVTPLWQLLYRAGVEVILVGHDHIYERFAPLTPLGEVDQEHGIRQFIVGTGGAQLYPITEVRTHSRARNTESFGALELRMREASYRWRFVPVDQGGFRDRGSARCHGAPEL